MLSDTGITIAGHVVTSFQLLVLGALLLCTAAILIGHRRELKATVRTSPVTDQLAGDLNRIADSLERLSNQASDLGRGESGRAAARRAEARAAEARAAEARAESEPAGEEAHRVAYSIFGR